MQFNIEIMEDVCAPISAYKAGYYCGKASQIILAIFAVALA